MTDESGCKIDCSSIMRVSRRLLVKVLLFQLDGHGHPQDDAMPSFFLDLENSIVGLSNEESFVSEIFWKVGKSLYLLLGGPKYMANPAAILGNWGRFLLTQSHRLVGYL